MSDRLLPRPSPPKRVATSSQGLLARALDTELGHLEHIRARAWLSLSAVIGVGGLLMLGEHTGEGAVGVVLGVTLSAWFLVVDRLLDRKPEWAARLGRVTFVIELGLPWGLFAVIVHVDSAVAALQGWGPPLLFAAGLVLSMLRLSARRTLLFGVLSAVVYVVVAWNVALPALPAEVREGPLYTRSGQIVRAAFLIGGAGFAAVVASGLRRAVGGVVRATRAHDLFGKYRLLEQIGEGGMGIVWRALYCPEGGFAREAAIKMIRRQLATDERFLERFRQEAELCARLNSDYIVQVFDFGSVGDDYFLAMELVDGWGLDDILAKATAADRPLPPAVAVALVRDILLGLSYAHDQATNADGGLLRVVHRDLAPANVLVTRAGRAKINDFGIARAIGESTAEQTTHIAGHLAHMAPEQLRDGRIDPRGDLFCAGIILWELLSGCPLFKRATKEATLSAILFTPIPKPSALNEELAVFDAFFDRALSREIDGRFATAADMESALVALVAPAPANEVARTCRELPERRLLLDTRTNPTAVPVGAPA